MPPFTIAVVAVAALGLWLVPLLRMRSRNRAKTVQTIDHRARWGVSLEAVGYLMMWASGFWNRELPLLQFAAGVALLIFGVFVSFQAAAALGDMLRIDASLSTEHRLVRRGPYRFVRHPVYSSFLCLAMGTGLLVAPWWLMGCGMVVFLCGTEIRVRVEDALLGARFGAEFEEYRRSVAAYLPGIR